MQRSSRQQVGSQRRRGCQWRSSARSKRSSSNASHSRQRSTQRNFAAGSPIYATGALVAPGEFNLIVDGNANGQLDPGVDALDRRAVGFSVRVRRNVVLLPSLASGH